MLTHDQLRAKVPKVRRESVPPGGQFQPLVERNLCSLAHAMLNARQRDGRQSLDSGNSHHVATLARWLMLVADQDYADDFTDHAEGVPAKYRLSRAKLERDARKRAGWIIGRWSPLFLEHKARGGRHGAADGVTKGPARRFTEADLLPYVVELPARAAKREVQRKTGMSDATYYRLLRGSQETK